MFKKASKSVRTLTIVVSPDPSLLLHQILQLWRCQKTDKDPNDPDWADEGDVQIEYTSDWLYGPSIAALTKNYF